MDKNNSLKLLSKKGHVNRCPETLVKQLKMARKENIKIKSNTFLSFKK